jgi:hypothetical protein
MDDSRIMDHHHANNTEEAGDNTFNQHPAWINEVACEPPDCPLTEGQVERLRDELAATVNLRSHDMDIHRHTWVTALELCAKLYAEQEESSE